MSNDKSFLKTADKIIKQLKDGTAPWVRPWEVAPSAPFNPESGTKYRGINNLSLQCEGRSDPRWMTYKQADAKEMQVRKGEKGTGIVFWQFTKQIAKKDAGGRPVKDSKGNSVKQVVRLKTPRLFRSTVFNGEQIEGMPALPEVPKLDKIEINNRAQGILDQSGAEIAHDGGNRAFYRPSTDSIHLPTMEVFKSSSDYYATAMHELGHWTGAPERLDRDLSGGFGTPAYASEELIAEVYSYMMSSELELPHDPSNHVSYIGSWIEKLENDPTEIYRAAKDAEQIKDYTLAFDLTLQNERENEKHQERPSKIYPVPEEVKGDVSLTTVVSERSDALEKRDDEHSVIAQERDQMDFETFASNNTQSVGPKTPEVDLFGKEMADKAYRVEESPPESTRVTNTCMFTGELGYMDLPVSEERIAAFMDAGPSQRGLIQDVFPELSPDEREFMLTGILPETWSAMFAGLDKSNEIREPAVVREVDIVKDLKSCCENVGLVMKEDPKIDGRWHRVPVERPDGKANKDGSYKAYSDGRPAGTVVNHFTGEKMNWKSSSSKPMSSAERNRIKKQAQENKRIRDAETTARHAHKAKRVEQLLSALPKATDDNKYLKRKSIKASDNVYEDKKGRLVIPITDVKGKPQSVVRISDNGHYKNYMKGAKKAGGMHILGNPKEGDDILVAEGYSTAKTLREATGLPVVAAFDAGNLATVALEVQKAYTTATVFVAGDDDRENDRNIGRTKAIDAARAVKGRAIFPSFSTGAKGSDFNDLSRSLQKTMDKYSANNAIKSQINTGIRKGRAAEKHQSKSQAKLFENRSSAGKAKVQSDVKTKTAARSR